MYVKYFKFKGKPFGINPDPKFFFNSKTHKRALSCLGYGLGQGQGFIIITGNSGTGKTTLMSALTHMLASTNIITASIINTQLQDDEMLRYVAAELALPFEGLSKVSLLKSLETFFEQCVAHDNRVIILIDEAQNISDSAIEELRMLMNLVKGSESVLQIVLFGQNSLQQHLVSERFESVNQRTVASYELTNLGEEETKAYITLRLRAVGWLGDPEISPGAYLSIYENSQGIPAKINMMCGKLLQAASVKEEHLIIEDDVQNIEREMNHNFSDNAFSGSLVEGVVEAIMGQRMKALAERQSIAKKALEVKKPESIAHDETPVEVEEVEVSLPESSSEKSEIEIAQSPEIEQSQLSELKEAQLQELTSPELSETVEEQINNTDMPDVFEDSALELKFDTVELTVPEMADTIDLEMPPLVTDMAGTLELTAPELIELEETIEALEEQTMSSEDDNMIVLEVDIPNTQGVDEAVKIESYESVELGLDNTFELEPEVPTPLSEDDTFGLSVLKDTNRDEEETLDLDGLTPIEEEGFPVNTSELTSQNVVLDGAETFDMKELASYEMDRSMTQDQIVDELTADELAIQQTIESLEIPVVDDLEVIGLDESDEEGIPMISEQISSEEAFMETSKLADSGQVDGEIQQWLQQKKDTSSGAGWNGRKSQTDGVSVDESVDDFESTLEDQK